MVLKINTIDEILPLAGDRKYFDYLKEHRGLSNVLEFLVFKLRGYDKGAKELRGNNTGEKFIYCVEEYTKKVDGKRVYTDVVMYFRKEDNKKIGLINAEILRFFEYRKSEITITPETKFIVLLEHGDSYLVKQTEGYTDIKLLVDL